MPNYLRKEIIMIKRDSFRIESNEMVANDVFEMKLIGDTSAIKTPGQFVHITVPGVFLPRPISISDYNENSLDIFYKVVGKGTDIMSEMNPGENLTLLTGLGNGFDLNVPCEKPLLIGGGLGVAPLYKLAVELKKRGKDATIITGFKTEEDVILDQKLNDLYLTYVALENNGKYRLVTDVFEHLPNIEQYDYFYACGPKPMLKAVCDNLDIDGEVSLESRMACGIGQCKCCSVETEDGMKTLCKDGPVLKRGQVRW